MPSKVEQMKWWGWGVEGTGLELSDKPDLWPFIRSVLGIRGDFCHSPPAPIERISVPPPRNNDAFLRVVRDAAGTDRVVTDKEERLVHAYGKSYRDLWRIRHGIVESAPDCVIYPESEDHVQFVVRAACDHQVVLIPYGGGSNIAGCLEAKDPKGRMIASLDMKLMNRVLHVDEPSHTARIEAGVMGPHLEDQLNARGFTLGHFPDSFQYSTLGGWIATRSAGMQSDKYGKIEDMVLSLRVVTPSGTIVTRTVPKSSNGIDVNHLCIGSEGILGVITEATMQVHRCPKKKEFYGYVFPDFESGIDAIRTCIEKECTPVITRLNDASKTALSFAYATRTASKRPLMEKVIKAFIQHVRGIDWSNCCLMITAFEGDQEQFQDQKRKVGAIYRRFGGACLGTRPGRAFERGKYDFPHLRDIVMDRNIMADVSETTTVWSNILPLYDVTRNAIEQAIRRTGSRPFVGCHISHTYQTGASVYFTFACLHKSGKELEQYLYIKKAAEDSFLRHGATLSHHHAVGFEHLPWVTDDISATGVKAVRSLKSGLDPTGIMNPGKIIPPERPFDEWGLDEHDIRTFDAKPCLSENP